MCGPLIGYRKINVDAFFLTYLTHLMPLVSLPPENTKKIRGFLMFSGGIERYQLHEIRLGQCFYHIETSQLICIPTKALIKYFYCKRSPSNVTSVSRLK